MHCGVWSYFSSHIQHRPIFIQPALCRIVVWYVWLNFKHVVIQILDVKLHHQFLEIGLMIMIIEWNWRRWQWRLPWRRWWTVVDWFSSSQDDRHYLVGFGMRSYSIASDLHSRICLHQLLPQHCRSSIIEPSRINDAMIVPFNVWCIHIDKQ